MKTLIRKTVWAVMACAGAVVYGSDMTVKLDLSGYAGDQAIVATAAPRTLTNGLFEIHLDVGDSITNGLVTWDRGSFYGYSEAHVASNRYIRFTPPLNGKIALTGKFRKRGGVSAANNRFYAIRADAVGFVTRQGATRQAALGTGMQCSLATDDTTVTKYLAVSGGQTYWVFSSHDTSTNDETAFDVTALTYYYDTNMVAVATAVNNEVRGYTVINGVRTNTASVQAGYDVTFEARPTDSERYVFSGWTDATGAIVSTAASYATAASNLVDGAVLTANFSNLKNGEEAIRQVDGYLSPDDSAEERVVTNGCFEIHLGSATDCGNDRIDGRGLFWGAPGVTADGGQTCATNRYVKFTPMADGTLELSYQCETIDYNSATPYGRIYVATGEAFTCTSVVYGNAAGTNVNFLALYSNTTVSVSVESGKTYFIWSYSRYKPAQSFRLTDLRCSYAAKVIPGFSIHIAAADRFGPGVRFLKNWLSPQCLDRMAGTGSSLAGLPVRRHLVRVQADIVLN